RGGWLPHHLLTLVWTGAALAILTASWAGATVPRIGPGLWEPGSRERAAAPLASLFPRGPARRRGGILGLLGLALALRGAWNDPARPYWSAAVTLAVSVLLGALAVWSRRPVYVYASGMLFGVIGYLTWQAWLVDRVGIRSWLPWGPGILDVFFYTE